MEEKYHINREKEKVGNAWWFKWKDGEKVDTFGEFWSDEIANLEQDESNNEVPEDCEDEILQSATIDLENAIDTFSFIIPKIKTEENIYWEINRAEDNNFKLKSKGESIGLIKEDEICKSFVEAIRMFLDETSK